MDTTTVFRLKIEIFSNVKISRDLVVEKFGSLSYFKQQKMTSKVESSDKSEPVELTHDPQKMKCPHCEESVETKVSYKIAGKTHLMAFTAMLFAGTCCFPFGFIPYCKNCHCVKLRTSLLTLNITYRLRRLERRLTQMSEMQKAHRSSTRNDTVIAGWIALKNLQLWTLLLLI